MFGRKKKDSMTSYVPPFTPQELQELPSLPQKEEVKEVPVNPFVEKVQQAPKPLQHNQPSVPKFIMKVIAGEQVEEKIFRYVIVTNVSMKIGDEIEWRED